MKFLLEHGSDPNYLTKAVTIDNKFVPSISPLYLILQKKFSSFLCNLLLSHGANIDLKMGTTTALMRHLYKWGHRREPELKFLIEHDADIDIVDENTGYRPRDFLKKLGLQTYIDYYDANIIHIKEPE